MPGILQGQRRGLLGGGMGFSALSWSSLDYFVRKGYSWCYTDKQMNEAKLIVEENLFFTRNMCYL